MAEAPRQILPQLVPKPNGQEGQGISDHVILESALVSLAARMGSMTNLPELHTLIQDTVNATLRSLRGIVDVQVKKSLETMHLPTVQELVAKSMTTDIGQSTTQAAQLLARQDLEALELGQRRCGESIAAVEKGLRKLQEEAATAIKELQGQQLQGETDSKQLQFRVAQVEKALAERPDLTTQVKALEDRVGALRGLDSIEESLKKLVSDAVAASEGRSRENFVTNEAFTEASKLIKQLEQETKEHGDQWLSDNLKPLEGKLAGLEEKLASIRAELQASQTDVTSATTAKLEAALKALKDDVTELQTNGATKKETQNLREEARQARGRLALEFRRQCTKLSDQCTHLTKLTEETKETADKLGESLVNCAMKKDVLDAREEARQARGRLALEFRRQISKLASKYVERSEFEKVAAAAPAAELTVAGA